MRILIVPSSSHGGTAEIGRAIARQLRAAGIDVDVSQPAYAGGLGRYDGFIVGSAVYEGTWMPAALQFVRSFATELSERPVWLFTSGLTVEPDVPSRVSEDVINELVRATNAKGHELFGGRLRLDDLEPDARAIAIWAGLTDTDLRDWHDISIWVDTIIESMVCLQT